VGTPNRRAGQNSRTTLVANVGNTFERAGFKRADTAVKKRIIMAIDGREKSGKSHFALSGPQPIGVINLDIGLDGVVQKWQDDKDIWVTDVKVNIQQLKELSPQEAAKEADRAYTQVVRAYQAILGEARTIIWDNATEIWELLRMARFGKLDHVKPHHYGPVNAEYRELLRMAYDQDKTNLILLHKMKDEYVDDKRTGLVKRAGFSDTGFLVQMNALCWRGAEDVVPDCFHMTIADCRQNAELANCDINGAELNFPYIAKLVFPDTEEADWL
jgi:hypothetical protein